MSYASPTPAVSSAPTVTPRQLLDSADRLLTSPVPGVGSQWPRVCALLIRLALELSLDEYWSAVLPSAKECGMRQQMLLLPLEKYAGRAAGSLAQEAWLGLSRAAHHHTYELAPTAAELRRWHSAVTRLVGLLAEDGSPAAP